MTTEAEIKRCEDCQFIRLAVDFTNNDRAVFVFAKCKASTVKSLNRVSEIFHAEEVLCSVMREGESDECFLFRALEAE